MLGVIPEATALRVTPEARSLGRDEVASSLDLIVISHSSLASWTWTFATTLNVLCQS